jgi:origin recognition complex subunit 4
MTSNRTPGSGRRKRTRTEEDDLPSSPVTASQTTNVATSVKRRRLNGVSDSPRSTPKGFSAITSAIGGTLGRSRGRNGTQRKSAGAQDNTVIESSSGVLGGDEEEEEETFSSKPKKLDFGTAPKVTKSTKSLYDVPDSGDEQDSTEGTSEQNGTAPVTPSKRKARKPKEKPPPLNPTPARRGRPPKPKPVELLSIPAVKARIYGPAGLGAAAAASRVAFDPPKLKGILTPQKRKVGRPAKTVKTVAFDEDEEESDLQGGDVPPKPRWSALMNRSREQISAGPPTSVVLDQTNDSQKDEVESHGKDAEEAELELEAEEDDDEVCVICSKPDSEPPNEIIFCEVCDRGFHQKCYDVPVIPEGDWICRTCSQEDILPGGTETRKKESPTTTVDIPEIPNFEQHLQKMRQVLLERCSGNRRIKLRGQSEAYEKAFQLVEQTVLAGEGNSMMVIGSRGCGKTTVRLFSGCLHHVTTNKHDR